VVEQRPFKPKVVGSIPTAPTKTSRNKPSSPVRMQRTLHCDVQAERVQELVESKKMSDREFHDAILHEGQMPIEMLRVILTKQKVGKDFQTSWKFYGPSPGGPAAK
jgi:hypothetical protein